MDQLCNILHFVELLQVAHQIKNQIQLFFLFFQSEFYFKTSHDLNKSKYDHVEDHLIQRIQILIYHDKLQ